jgi:hypothetical protein
MLIFLGVLLGNLSAIAVNVFAWQMRRNQLQIIVTFGILVLPIIFLICFVEPTFLVVTVLSLSIASFLQVRQIPAPWWIASLALLGELGIWMTVISIFWLITYWVKFIIQASSPFLCAYAITAVVLTFLRPLCLRWARPFWQVLKELKPSKT